MPEEPVLGWHEEGLADQSDVLEIANRCPSLAVFEGRLIEAGADIVEDVLGQGREQRLGQHVCTMSDSRTSGELARRGHCRPLCVRTDCTPAISQRLLPQLGLCVRQFEKAPRSSGPMLSVCQPSDLVGSLPTTAVANIDTGLLVGYSCEKSRVMK